MAFQYTDFGGNPIEISAERLNAKPADLADGGRRGVSSAANMTVIYPHEAQEAYEGHVLDELYSEGSPYLDDPDAFYALCEEQDEESKRAPSSVEEATDGIRVDAITGEVTDSREITSGAFVIAKATEKWMEERGRRFAAGMKNWRSETERSPAHSRKSEERAIARQARIDAKRQKKEEKRLARGGADGRRYVPVAAKKRQKGHTLRRHREVLRSETTLFLAPEAA